MNLTQEIGRDLSDDEQAQVLALARALWLPGQLDESDWLPDPAGVTLHWRPALDGREGPVLRVVETQPDSPYAAGALIFWQGERLLTLTPSQPGFNIMYDQGASTWVETDTNGQLIRFVDNTSPPDSHTYLKWVIPQDLGEDGRFSIFMIQDTDPNNGDARNSGGPTAASRCKSPPPSGNVPIADYLTANPNHTLSEIDGQLAITDGDTILFALNPETMEWEQAANPAEAFFVQAQELYGEPYGINLDPNVEVKPNGEFTVYATNEAGDRYIAVRSAVDEDGNIVPVFAVESHIAANHQVIRGGSFTTASGVNVTFGYMNGTRELHQAEIVVQDQNKFLTGLDGLFPIPTGTCVIDTSRPATATPPYTCFSEQVPEITDVKVIVSDSSQPIPETKNMIVLRYHDGNTLTRISYYWHPDQPDNLVVHVNMDPNLTNSCHRSKIQSRTSSFWRGVISTTQGSYVYTFETRTASY
jgi:hypothetical protein